MRDKMREVCPEWTGYELESDPANKVLEVAAYREMLLRQRVNEAVRGVMIAFAAGSDLDHLAAFYPEERLAGAAATFAAKIVPSTALDLETTVPTGYSVVSNNGAVEARLMHTVTIPPGDTFGAATFEIVRPTGMEGDGLSLQWQAITPLPFIASVEQLEPSHGGSDDESDDDFRRRIPMALESYSPAGPKGAYEYWALSADPRIKDVSVTSPEPGYVDVYLLSREGDGTADEAMIARVAEILSTDKVIPIDDKVTVRSVRIVEYKVKMTIVLYAGVAGSEPLAEAKRRVEAKVEELHRCGLDIARSALIAAAHVEGVKTVELVEPAKDIHIIDSEAGWCKEIEIGSRVADEP